MSESPKPDSHLPAWERPESKSPRVTYPDTPAQRALAVLLFAWPAFLASGLLALAGLRWLIFGW